ncbi:MAG: lysine--tRNA ligase [Acidobacteriota bacterium]|jgi:lysyl-tRNA synthetase class 2|nr:lysine--tRNA ligase [Acidobacteriota bacterium]
MENQTNILEQRQGKLAELARLGCELYPHKFDHTHTVSGARAAFEACDAAALDEKKESVRVCGRILSLRPHGKAGFMDVSDGESRIQVYVRRDFVGQENFALFKLFDLGDIIGVEGTVFRTHTGELTVSATQVFHLAKNLLPLPEKWHGLTDVETRFRQRYVDLIINPEVRSVFAKRSRIIREIRNYLDGHGYTEVETPVLQAVAGGALARPFITHHNALDIDLYMRIALELYLKRLIVGGIPRVYELGRIFRNEGISTRHNPEFTMVEFYQAYSDYRDLMDLTEELITRVAEAVTGGRQVAYGEHVLDFGSWRRLTMKEAVLEFWPASLPAITAEDLVSVERLRELAGLAHTKFDPADGAGKLLSLVFETVAEEHLVQPTIIYDHPAETSPLSKKKADDPATAERFELYIAGMEIANAYSELNDPAEQKARFEEQLAARGRGDEEAHEMDHDYIRALSYGMPPTAGEGIGIDRLTMVLTNSQSVREVILFPLLRPETAEP